MQITILDQRRFVRSEGAAEQIIGGSITANPYEMGSNNWVDWRAGFNASALVADRPSGPLPSHKPGVYA